MIFILIVSNKRPKCYIFVPSLLEVTSNINVTIMNENNDSLPLACTENLMAMRDTIDILGGKWKLQILHYLAVKESEKNTFKKIERGILGISAKMLSKELKDLEMNQLITRTVVPTKPVTVEYAITEYGKTAKDITDKLVEWGINHRKHLLGK